MTLKLKPWISPDHGSPVPIRARISYKLQIMSTAAHRAAVQTALLSVRGLRRRRLGHVSPTDYPQNGLDKWGRKRLEYNHYNGTASQSLNNKTLTPSSPLLNGSSSRRPVVPRATLVLGGEKSIASKSRRNNDWNSTSSGGLETGVSTTTSTIAIPQEESIRNINSENVFRSDLPNHATAEQQQEQAAFSTIHSQTNVSSHAITTDTDDVTIGPIPLNNMHSAIQHAGAERTSKRGGKIRSSSSNSRSRTKYSSDLIVILDMDECLIHSQFLSDRCVDKYRQVEDRPTSKSSRSTSQQQRQHGHQEADSLLFTNAGCDSFRIHLPDGDLVNVNKRPNLDIFLREITSKFETYIFTAAVEVYASPVLNQLDPAGNMFRGRFYREHCRFDPDLGVYAKDVCDVLRMRQKMRLYDDEDVGEGYGMDGYGYDEAAYDDRNMTSVYENHRTSCDARRVVLVDNNPLSFLPNPSNGILVSSFYDDPKDDTLEAVMELLHELDESDDVRPILDDRFGLREALDDVTKGAAAIRW